MGLVSRATGKFRSLDLTVLYARHINSVERRVIETSGSLGHEKSIPQFPADPDRERAMNCGRISSETPGKHERLRSFKKSGQIDIKICQKCLVYEDL